MKTQHDAKIDAFVDAVRGWMEEPTCYSIDLAIEHVRHLADGYDSAQLAEGAAAARTLLGGE